MRERAIARVGKRQRGRCGGFTLLETVVTLVIVSMLVAMLMQALGHSLNVRARLLRVQGESRTELLQEAWFRETVGAAQADLEDAMGGMEGEPDSLAYASTMPLASHGMARVRWWVQADGARGASLHYSDPDARDVVVVPGPLQDAGFAYMDHAGAWHDEWKPAPEATERLPRLIRFEARTAKGRLYWLVPLLVDPIPQERMHPDEVLGNGI